MEFILDANTYGPLLLEGDYLYFATWKSIWSVRKDGRELSARVSDLEMMDEYSSVSTFAMDRQYFFWNDRNYGIVRSNRAGGSKGQLSTEWGGVATDGQHLYFMTRGRITRRPFSRVDRDGQNLVRLLEGGRYDSSGSGPLAILLDETHAYVAFPRWIVRVPKTGGESTDLATGLNIYSASMVASDSRLFWLAQGGVMSVAKTGGTTYRVFPCGGSPGPIAIEGDDLFWICGQDLYTKPVSGGVTRVLARSIESKGHGLAVDSRAIYFSASNRIMRLAR